MSHRAPKQWTLTKTETITTFENWKSNLVYTLSLDPNFAKFLVEGLTWEKKSNILPLRGFIDDTEAIPAANRLTGLQKVVHLELMLGQIANFCPILSRNTFLKNSTSINSIWQSIRLHFGFQSSGSHFLDFAEIKLESDERYEDLFQRLSAFVEDNLLKANGGISHYGDLPTQDEDIAPSLENLIVLIWLKLIHQDMPKFIKQRYGTELRSRTLASIKPEISQALPSLIDELRTTESAKVFRGASTNFQNHRPYNSNNSGSGTRNFNPNINKQPRVVLCPLCKASKRDSNHYLSKCKFLPASDRRYFTKTRMLIGLDTDIDDFEYPDQDNNELENSYAQSNEGTHNVSSVTLRRVNIKQSPYLFAYFNHHSLRLTLDTGAETNFMRESIAKSIGCKISKSSQIAFQADGRSQMSVIGETRLILSRNGIPLSLDALIVTDLDVDILAGTPFMMMNDVSVRPARFEISIKDLETFSYGMGDSQSNQNTVRRVQSQILRAPPISNVVWPGDFLEVHTPIEFDNDCLIAIEPKLNDMSKYDTDKHIWPEPSIVNSIGGMIRIPNHSSNPIVVKKNTHICTVYKTSSKYCEEDYKPILPKTVSVSNTKSSLPFSHNVSIDPDSMLSDNTKLIFKELLKEYDNVFNPKIIGYNGKSGPLKATVNMGPVLPPQRKGRVPQYSRNKLVELQSKFDELEDLGVFKRPEDIHVVVEYLNPSFLVMKKNGGSRLVTSFGDVGRYSKPQPALMPDVDSVLRTIGAWKYIIKTDLTKSFYQIPLSHESLKYCGVSTPFKGTRVYTKSAMGMPGSETALEELMSLLLGDLIQEGNVAKIADDLYCGSESSIDELLLTWKRVLEILDKNDIRLSASKTIICPKSTVILGWMWSYGHLNTTPHRVATLATCPPPKTVKNLRSFIGAYKMLSRVLKDCALFLDPFDQACAGRESNEKILWTEELNDTFIKSQKALSNNKTIALPRSTDELWIVTDGSTKQTGLGATLYISRNGNMQLAGFFSAKTKKNQCGWIPCEIEALSIAASVKHFSPYIIQSKNRTRVLTDSKPCVQAYDKLCRGEFSASPRVTTFLSVISRYQASIQHIKGIANMPSDFQSRNAPPCNEPLCQICMFTNKLEDCVIREITVKDIVSGNVKLPFISRSAWINSQLECNDLRRAHAHLKQGTRPSKKLTNIRDVKRYIQSASIGKDELLIVRNDDPFTLTRERIIVPRHALDGLLTALHIKFNHPTQHQLKQMFQRYFYALDLDKSLELVSDSCHICTSLKHMPDTLLKQSSSDPPDVVGISFAADVIRRYRQCVLVLRETVTSFTSSCIIDDEKSITLRDSLACLCVNMKTIGGPSVVIRVDPAPGFVSLHDDQKLKEMGISLEIGRTKNPNKNPVAEHAVRELEDELLRQDPSGGPISRLVLTLATSRLNSRIRSRGLSSREMWTQRDQCTNLQIPISDRKLIESQHASRSYNHPYSERSKAGNKNIPTSPTVNVGDLVYIRSEGDKTRCRDRYLVVTIDGDWCNLRKFIGSQLRSSSYRVKRHECFTIPKHKYPDSKEYQDNNDDDYSSSNEQDGHDYSGQTFEYPKVPLILSTPLSFEDEPSSSDPNDQPDIDTDIAVGNNDIITESTDPSDSESTQPPRRSNRMRRKPERYDSSKY